MANEMDIFSEHPERDKPRSKPSSAILWSVILALAAVNIAAIWRINDTQDQLKKMEQTNQAMATTMSSLRDSAHDLAVRADTNEAMIRGELRKAQQMAKTESRRAALMAGKKAADAVKRVEVAYRAQRTGWETELGGVHEDTRRNTDQISAVMGNVDQVRGDVAEAQTDLARTQQELQSVKGDLGVQSGLVATNAKELTLLRRLGERDYYEFQLPKDGKVHKVSRDVVLKLRKTKPKRGKYTVDVIADDRRVEKQDRTINEPVQFYVSGSRQPYELVVNRIENGKVAGYLATPKVLRARLQAK